MISTDRGILEEGTAVRQRMVEYGSLVEELHIIVFSVHSKQYTAKAKSKYPVYSCWDRGEGTGGSEAAAGTDWSSGR